MSDERVSWLDRGQLLRSVLVTLALASVLSVLVVFPAELHYDPTGFGRLTGLLRPTKGRSAPATPRDVASASTSTEFARSFRSDVIDIPLGLGAELEYKVAMNAGDVFVYSWTILGPGKVYYEFHGESEPPEPRVESYLTADGAHEANGALQAPFAGIHGWYLLNDSETPIVVRLRISGFYQLSEQFASIGSAKKL